MTYQAIPPSFNALDTNQWIYNNENFMRGLIPQLTKFTYVKIGSNPVVGTATTNMGSTEGGAKTFAAGASYITSTVFQTCKTGKFAFAFRGKFAVPVGGRNALAGLTNVAGTHDIMFGWITATDATKYIFIADGTISTSDTTTLVVDTAQHDHVVTGDGSNLRYYVDKVLYVTRAITTNVVDEPMMTLLSNTAAGDMELSDYLYGYIAP